MSAAPVQLFHESALCHRRGQCRVLKWLNEGLAEGFALALAVLWRHYLLFVAALPGTSSAAQAAQFIGGFKKGAC